MIRKTHNDLLFIGDAINARDLRQRYDRKISAMVDLAANESPAQLGRDIIYCRFPLHDDGSNSPQMIRTAITGLCSLLAGGFATLVACSAGMSRSPIIAAAVSSLISDCSFDDSLAAIVRDSPHDISPALLSSVASIHATMVSPAIAQTGG